MNKIKARPKASSETQPWLLGIVMLVIAVVTAMTYWNVFDTSKEFTNWDDTAYVTEQPLIRKLDGATIERMFDTETRVAANYHPLTMLSLAVDYQRGGATMKPFMQTTLLLHVLNTMLVFWLVYALSRKRLFMAALVAALFGVHPMHVESVAWVAERKDVLYTFFYLLGLIAYLRYLRTTSWMSLAAAFVAFVASCMSKPMAVTFPVLLLCVDYLEQRSWSVRSIAEKVPFFAVALVFGLLTLDVQSATTKGLVDTTTYSMGERLLFALYGIGQYVIKLVAPVNLSATYPYPQTIQPALGMPTSVYVSAIAVTAGLVGAVVTAVRSRSEAARWVTFGVAWFVVTVSIVLQFISVGAAVIADRYTYVPYVGLWIAAAFLIERLSRTQTLRTVVYTLVVVIVGTYVVLASNRVDVWRNSETLWTDVIEQYPYTFEQRGKGTAMVMQGIAHAYNNRAVYYLGKNRLAEAEQDYVAVIAGGTTKAYTFKGYGGLLQRTGRDSAAIVMLSTAIDHGGFDPEVVRARALSLTTLRRFDEAISDWRTLVSNLPNNITDQLELSNALLKSTRYAELLQITDGWIAGGVRNTNLHLMRGFALGMLARHDDAIAEFDRAVALDPSNQQARNNAAIARQRAKR
jgi:Tfp pilus assembly protein PilF